MQNVEHSSLARCHSHLDDFGLGEGGLQDTGLHVVDDRTVVEVQPVLEQMPLLWLGLYPAPPPFPLQTHARQGNIWALQSRARQAISGPFRAAPGRQYPGPGLTLSHGIGFLGPPYSVAFPQC